MYPFTEGSFAVRNGWYVAAFAREVGRGLTARTILNQPVVLYRREDGTAVAVGGRCPHRHYPLAASCLRGDEVVCGYHGIAFGPDGQCTDIPSQAFVPRSYRIPTYPLVEHGMWLWIWPGDPDLADPALLPDLAEIGHDAPGTEARPFYFHEVACRYQLLNDNILDLSHLAVLHGGSIGQPENASAPEELVKRPGFLSSHRHMRDTAPPPSLAAVTGVSAERVNRTSGMCFHLPGFHAGIDETRLPDDHPDEPGRVLRSVRVFHAITPATAHSAYYWFGMASPSAAMLDAMEPYLVPVVAEDIFASEEIEKMLRLVGHPREFMLKSDTNAVEARRMLQAMMDAEAAADAPAALVPAE